MPPISKPDKIKTSEYLLNIAYSERNNYTFKKLIQIKKKTVNR